MSYAITGPLRPPPEGWCALCGAPSPSRVPPYIAFVGGFRGFNDLNINFTISANFWTFLTPSPPIQIQFSPHRL